MRLGGGGSKPLMMSSIELMRALIKEEDGSGGDNDAEGSVNDYIAD